jgi:hypothetical protein
MATTAALSVASVIGAFMVYRTAGSYVSPLTAIRVLFALGAVSLLGLYMPYFGKLMVIPQAAGMTLLSILLLLISGEVGKKDLEVLRKVIRRKA